MYNQQSIPDFILAGLYPNSLVIIGEKNEKNKIAPEDKGSNLPISNKEKIENKKNILPETFWFGDNQRHIVMLMHDPANSYIGDDNLDLLKNILKACGFTLADIAIVNIARTPILLKDLQEKLSPQHILFFQCKQSHIGEKDDLRLYQPDRRNGCTYLLASSLSKMNDGTPEARQEKQRFWISLKQIFKID